MMSSFFFLLTLATSLYLCYEVSLCELLTPVGYFFAEAGEVNNLYICLFSSCQAEILTKIKGGGEGGRDCSAVYNDVISVNINILTILYNLLESKFHDYIGCL